MSRTFRMMETCESSPLVTSTEHSFSVMFVRDYVCQL